jgi:hypothetical protein
MEPVDDLAVVAILLETLISLVEKREGLKQQRPEGFPEGVMDEDVVHADAGLPAVEELPEEDAVYSRAYLGRLIHDHGTLPSQLQDTGNEVLCSLNGHQSSCCCRPCKADHINRQTRHCLCHLHPPLNYSEKPYITIGLRLSMCRSKSFLMTPEDSAASSLGFRMTQFPAAMAAATWGIAV